MRHSFIALLLLLFTPLDIWSYYGDTFSSNTSEGVEMKFSVISEENRTCGVYAHAIKSDVSGTITIPSEVNGYTVVEIQSEAFRDCETIDKVIIPSSIQRIQSRAFLNCTALKSIGLSNAIKSLGAQAFCNCISLESIFIPASVNSIGYGVIMGCKSLKSVIVDGNNEKYDSRENSNTIINSETGELIGGCNASSFPSGIKKIADDTFYGCNFTSVELPEGLESLGKYVFSSCLNLESISFPTTMKEYGEYTINGVSSMKQLIIKATVPPVDKFHNFFWGVPDDFDIYKFTWFVPKGTRELYVQAIPWWSGKEKGIIESGDDEEVINFADDEVKSICVAKYDANYSGEIDKKEAEGALTLGYTPFSSKVFAKNTLIKNFNEFSYFINITQLPSDAFSGCSSLEEISLPINLTEIGSYAFYGCKSLSSIIIPCSVTSIGNSAFSECDELKSVSVLNNAPIIFDSYTNPFPLRQNTVLYVPKGSKESYSTTNYWKDFKRIVEMVDVDGDGVATINDIITIMNVIAGKETNEEFKVTADLNGDKVVNIADIIILVNQMNDLFSN